MTAPSPGIISTTMLNAFYKSHDDYLDAIAREMKNEYQAIHKAGLILQIDAPDLAMDRTMMYRDLDDAGFVKRVERHVAGDQRRHRRHPARPRAAARLLRQLGRPAHPRRRRWQRSCRRSTRRKVGALSIEFSNPRHAHEYDALKKHPLPKDMLLIPGVVETTSNFVEHPEVVARRIEEAVRAVGERERVIASTDCGFGTFTKREWVIEPVVWLKLAAIRKGADIASARLWGARARRDSCRHSGTAAGRTRNPDARTELPSGFRVRWLSLAPRNDRINTIHFSSSPGHSSAALFLCGAGYAVVLERDRIARKKNRGRAGRQGSKWTRGPRRLATSRLVEVLCASPAALVRAKRQSVPQVRQTQGVPRAVFNRLAPHRPRWSHFSRVMPVGAAPRLPTDEAMALGRRPLTGRPGLPAVRDLGAQTRRAGLDAAWTAGPPHRISDARSCPGHRSPPRVWRR